MQIRTRTLALVLAAQLTSIFWARSLAADEAIPSERRLPRDVVAYLSLRNVAELRTQWGQSLVGRLVQDDSLADFRNGATAELAEASSQIQQKFGLGLSDLLEIPQGEFAVAAAVQPDGKLTVVVLLDFGEKDELIHKLLEKLTEQAESNNLKRSEEEFEDTKLVVHRQPAGEGNDSPQEVAAHCLKDTFLVLGNNASAVKGVLSRWDGKHDSTLAENPVFRYVSDKCRDEHQEAAPLLTWFLDPIGIGKAYVASQPQLGFQGAMVLGMLPTLGVDKLKGIGGSFDMARGEFDMVSRTLVYIEPPAKGVINLFQFDAVSQTPPKWVAADSASYYSLNWNIGKAYSAAESLADSFQKPGAFAQLIQNLADDEHYGNIHLKKDLIDQLTGKVHVIGVTSGRDEVLTDDYLVASEVRNASTAKALLRKISQFQGFSLKEREFQGEPLYEVESSGGDAGAMGLVVAENHLLFASNVKLLERVLRGSEGRESLADEPLYKKIAARFPENSSSVSFSREDNPLKSLEAVLRSPLPLALGINLSDLADKLPKTDAIKKYLTTSGGYMQPDEKGLKMTSFSLKAASE
ncbi:MAG: DUF3352 domain-containing protein [Planctomycetaceae bacterium]|nr:DUF3352 domain-containing protein [Planctomycetaceae bacterium]